MPDNAIDHRLAQTIIESSSDAILTKSLDGVIQSWNPAAAELFGVSAEAMIGSNVSRIIPPDLIAEERLIIARLQRGEQIKHYETRRQNIDGTPIDVSLTISPLYDDTGKVVGASNIIRDITERRRAELAVSESEERFRTLADNISQLAWMAEPGGGLFWYNRRWYDYTGTNFETMAGWGWKLVHHPDHVDRVVDKFQRAIATGEVWEDTFPLRSKEGEYRWFLSRAQPIRDESGAILRWFGTNTDVTAQREAEQALRDADDRKNEFLAMLAHELRNPLAPIRHGLDLIARDGRAETEDLEVIQHQVEQMVRLVDDLMDVSRIMRGKVELRRTHIDLKQLLSRAVETVRHTLVARGQDLRVSLPNEPVWCDGDAVRLSQVVGNLLNNASKYSDHGASIELSLAASSGMASIRVQDNGVGIEAELLPRVFELFTQATRSIDRSQGGLGIGLTVVQQLVELHGGRVTVTSEGLGAGATFTVGLPMVETKEAASVAPLSECDAEVEQALKVLVVDDNVGATWMLSKLLAKLGDHEIDVAHDGVSALARVLQDCPHLAILDIGLPGLDGYRLAEQIREVPSCPGVYLVALTGYGQPDDRRRALEAGFDEHLVKPASVADLERIIVSTQQRLRS
ncbi:PAS domain-containing hybrid sensor histidine kinase/response regulator [Botrimarina mediterranea]|uniref:histidine kinase n=1 Tax=Botrimarina mediterranea TaxID=2528022 RepID=A0A518K4X5_9BACT|nr:PAS domain S-box protein [Botrimarina mediterranea]QDV72849.1 Autoinducer 2 sensor kinase/phosphatase LuxQ [Botrimarina mediterranea]QDV77421.1 Autoinducer 2 sensor kinase/phosphatase LuxQ [Planctomycetes bacterium K2D]